MKTPDSFFQPGHGRVPGILLLLMVVALAGGWSGPVAGGAEEGAPVREGVDPAPDPEAALKVLVSKGGLDRGTAAELLGPLRAGNYREALRIKQEMADERTRLATGEFIWQRWLALDRDVAYAALLEMRGAGGATGDMDRGVAWLVSGRLYADRVAWTGKAFDAAEKDPGLREAILFGMIETWLLDGDAIGEELVAKSAEIPVPARLEILVAGCTLCCREANQRLRGAT